MPVDLEERPEDHLRQACGRLEDAVLEAPHGGDPTDPSAPPPASSSWRYGLWTLLLMVIFFGGVVGAFILLGHVSAGAAGHCGGG